MRIRTLKPGFFSSEDLSSVSAETHLLAGGLLCLADDSGFFNANPALIKAAIFPLRETSVTIHDMLTELSRIGFVRLGVAADARRYGLVVKFTEHQRINRPTPSKIKDLPIEWDASLCTHGAISEDSLPEGKGKERNEERKGEEKAKALAPHNGGAPRAIPPAPLNFATSPRSDRTPEGLNGFQYAKGLLEKLSVPSTTALLQIVEQNIRLLSQRDHISEADAVDTILASAQEAQARSETVNRFWFEDSRFIATTKGPVPEKGGKLDRRLKEQLAISQRD